jgi:hypothetical protein
MPKRLFPWRTFAAPVLGFVLVRVSATLIYLHDGSIRAFIYLAIGTAAICGVVEMASRYRTIGASDTLRHVSLTVGTAFLLLLLTLAPKWTGGARFAAFQGNHYDQLYYITQVATLRDSTYGALGSVSEHQPLILEGGITFTLDLPRQS